MRTYTVKNITESDLQALRREAIDHDDDDMACITIIAELGEFDGDMWGALSPSRKAAATTRDEALTECARVKNHTLAQQ